MEKINLGIQLQKPLAFFDLETTGTNVFSDRIVEISVVKVFPDGSSEVKTRRLNPEKPIPPEATAIHGIKDEDVKNEPTFKAVSSSLFRYLENCDLAGYNIQRFDIVMLMEEFKRSGLNFSLEGRYVIDAQTIYHKHEPRTLSAAYKYFCGKNLDDAHSAEADTMATLEIFTSQLGRYEDLPRDAESLHQYCNQRDPSWIDAFGKFRWKDGEPTIGFGRNEGIPLKTIAVSNPEFLKWIISANFPADAVEIAKNALKGVFPVKKNEDG